MAMDLVSEVSDVKQFIASEEGSFLQGLEEYITKIMEFHDTPENDSGFMYLLWVDQDKMDVTQFIEMLVNHIKKLQDEQDDSWEYSVISEEGFVFVIVYTWI